MFKAILFTIGAFVMTMIASMFVAFIIQIISNVVQKKPKPVAAASSDKKGGA